jgi:YrbI family 3-deoxy-D-manno-octulosonate 8-phosphate phosphatase
LSHFAKNLRYLRRQKQLSEADFALSLDVWEDTLKRYERDKAEPDLDTLIRIADALALPLDHLLRRDLAIDKERISRRKVKLILFDVDGTLTDGRMYYTESGDQFKAFHTKDGLIIHRLIKRQGVQFGFVSSGSNEALMRRRAETLGVQHLYAGTRPKLQVITEWCEQLDLSLDQIAFVGDDLNDLPLLRRVGVSACPADAVSAVKAAASVILTRRGGEGCAREFLEEVLGYDVQ